MSPVDAAWLHMDGPANLAEVTGLLTTREPLDFAAVRAVYAERLADLDRFHQRVVHQGIAFSTPCWEDVEHFDIDSHLHHIALAAPYDLEALRTLVADLASTPLNHDLPLWQVHVIDDVESGSALVMRYHHCMGDGLAMMAVAQRLFDPQTPTRARRHSAKPRPAQAPPHPAAVVVEGAGMLLSELLKWPDPQSPFKGEFGLRKQVAWSQPVALADVRAIGERHGAKVNDVLVSAMAGALRAYLQTHGVAVDSTTLRAMVPVNLRPPEQQGQLGNAFGLVVLDLPVNTAQPARRLALTHARMDALKHSAEPVAMEFLLNVFGRGPKALEDIANALFGSKASVVLTNVAGPPQPLKLAGAPIDRMMFWVPHPGRHLGMGISILSYCGAVTLTVISDAHLVPDPEAITAQFNREFAVMLHAVKTESARAAAEGRRPRHRA